MGKINVLGGTSGGGGGGTDPTAAHTDEDETITGAWDFTIAPTVDGDPISGGGDAFTPSYANALTGSRFTILYDGVSWPASRPSARSDIYFDLIGGAEAVADPGWMLDGDAREVVPS